MFHSARIKLTAWYLLIIMLVSFSFSIVIYRMTTFELDRIERMQGLRIERQLPESFRIAPPNNNVFLRPLDPELVVETKNRIKMHFKLLAVLFTDLKNSQNGLYFY
jgi:hypothetical protein